MYQAGPAKVAETISQDSGKPCSEETARGYINDYFNKFKKLKKWIDEQKALAAHQGYLYSHFGRKRRLPNVYSSDRAVQGHTIRSGINFLVQSCGSDVNLLACIDMVAHIQAHNMGAKIFALVHDSILAEVPDDEVEDYVRILAGYVQQDRGLSIPGCPIGCDFEIGLDYSMPIDDTGTTKYEKYVKEWNSSKNI